MRIENCSVWFRKLSHNVSVCLRGDFRKILNHDLNVRSLIDFKKEREGRKKRREKNLIRLALSGVF
jgi:hypothetical protein